MPFHLKQHAQLLPQPRYVADLDLSRGDYLVQ